MFTQFTACAIAAAIAAAPTTVFAAAAAAGGAPLTLESCVRRALESHPSMLAAERRVEATSARLGPAARRPLPELALSVENFGGALGGDFLESTASIEQRFELGGYREARRTAAGADVTEQGARRDAARRTLALETADRFLDAWAAREHLRAAVSAERTAAEAVTAAAERLRQGAAPEFERVRAEGHLATREVERRRAEAALANARSALAAQWGESVPASDSLVLPEPPAPPGREGAPQLAGHPEQRLAEAERVVAEARGREARAAAAPNVTVSGGVRYFENVRGAGFVAGVSLPLPFGSAAADLGRASDAERSAAEHEARATALRLRQAYDAALERERVAHEAWTVVNARVRPSADRALELVESGYRAGRLGYVDILEAQRSAFDARLLWIEATAEAWRARLALDALLGLTPDARDAEGSAR